MYDHCALWSLFLRSMHYDYYSVKHSRNDLNLCILSSNHLENGCVTDHNMMYDL